MDKHDRSGNLCSLRYLTDLYASNPNWNHSNNNNNNNTTNRQVLNFLYR